MAFQTLTSTASAESSSSTAPTDGGSSQGQGGSSNGGFTPSGSPPLILAFLAIGLFAAAMIVIFGWRRIQISRSWTMSQQEIHNAERRHLRMLEHKPKLWDLWTDLEDSTWSDVSSRSGGVGNIWQWSNIMPLSAKAVLISPEDHPYPHSIATNPPPPSGPFLQPAGRALWTTLSPHSVRDKLQLHRDRRKPYDLTSAPAPSSATLQVEFAIAMPSAEYPVYIRNEKDERYNRERRRERRDDVDYVIGVYKCPCDHNDI